MATSSPRSDSTLLDQLVALFLAEGFRTFTLADLADRLRCSKSTLYRLGHSKEQLTVNVVVQFFRIAARAVEGAAAAHDTPARQIEAYLRAVADALRPASPNFMRDLADHPATRAVYERNTQAAARRVGQMISSGIADGSFRPVHGAFVADTIAATMRRIQAGQILSNVGLSDARAYDELANVILHGIQR